MGQFRHAAVLVIFKRAHHFFNLQTQFSQAPDPYHKGGAKTRIDRAKRVDSVSVLRRNSVSFSSNGVKQKAQNIRDDDNCEHF